MASTAGLEAQILAEMETNPDAFAGGPVDDVLNIDAESKTIDLPLSESLFGVEGEKDVERKYFRCPKIVGDNIDLSTHQIYVHYATATTKTGEFDTNKMTGAYHCDDVEIDETGSYITFSWVLSDNALSQPGFVGFAVFAKYSEGEELKTKWKTQPAIGMVAMTVPDGEVIVEKYPDVINQIFTKLAEMEKGNVSDEAVAAAVADYMAANPVKGTEYAVQYIAQTLKEEQQTQARANIGAASSAEVSKLSEAVNDLKENGTGSGVTTAMSESLWALIQKTAFTEQLTDAELTVFKTAWGITEESGGGEEPDTPVEPTVTLSSISVTYTGGEVTVGTALTSLTGITVKAHYSDGSTASITGYTLSGTITEGSNTITVSYGGKTTTFIVTGVAESGGSENMIIKPIWTENKCITSAGNVEAYNGWYLSNEIDCSNASVLRISTDATSWFATPNIWGATVSGAETGFDKITGNSENNASYMGGNYSEEVWFDVTPYEYIRIATNKEQVYGNTGVVIELEV